MSFATGLLIVASGASAAWAGTSAYQTCCLTSSAGSCPSALQVIGPGTTITGSAQGWIAANVWQLSCDKGPYVDHGRPAVVSGPLGEGSVTTDLSHNAAACFDAACAMPADLCLRHDGTRAVAYQCSTGQVGHKGVWSAVPSADTAPVVIQGRVVKARREQLANTRAADTTGSLAKVHQAGRPTRKAVGSTSVMPGGRVAPMGGLDFGLPPSPPTPCVPTTDMYAPSNQQVDQGNEAMVAGEFATAMNKYRAAISINKCNAFAWAALGDAMLQQGRPAEARGALRIATQLMPNNFHAWANLGTASERDGDAVSAVEAYRKATRINPNHQPAAEGLQRLGG